MKTTGEKLVIKSSSVKEKRQKKNSSETFLLNNITKHKEGEDKVAKLFNAVEQSADIIFITNREGIIEYVNPAFETNTGYSKDEAINNTPRILNSGEMDLKYFEHVWASILNGEVLHTEMTNRRKNGELFFFEQTITPIKNSAGYVTNFISTGKDITERKKAEVALRQSEEDLKEAQRIAHVGSWHLDLASNKVLWTDELYRMYGFDSTLPPPLYSEHKKLFTPKSWEKLSDALANTVKIGIPYELELETLRIDGSTGWMWVIGNTVIDETGKTVGLFGVAQDITERKQAEVEIKKAMKEIEMISRFPMENPNPILRLSSDYVLLYANEAAQELLDFCGCSIGHTAPSFMCDLIKEVIALGFGKTTEKQFDDKTWSMTIVPIIDNGYVNIYCIDITERKKVELQINNINRVMSVLSHINMEIVRTRDTYELYQKVCKIAVEYGQFLMAWIGRVNNDTNKVDVMYSAGYTGEYLENLDIDMKDEILSNGPTGKAIKSGNHVISMDIENDGSKSPGRERALKCGYRSSISLVLKVFGKVYGIFNLYSNEVGFFDEDEIKVLDEVASDISFALEFIQIETERKLAEQELIIANKKLALQIEEKEKRAAELKIANRELVFQNEEKEKRAAELKIANRELVFQNKEKENRAAELIVAIDKAEEMNRLKSSFLANMSHELRTPMIGILGFSKLLAYSEDPETKETGELIYTSGKRLMDTLNQILDLSRIEAGESNLELSDFDLIEDATETVNLYRAAAKEMNLLLSFSSEYEHLYTRTDKKAIDSMLNNLINNAVKYTFKGSITVTVAKEKQELKDWGVIEVADTGIGIEEKNIKMIFREFRQVSEGLERNFDGTGLGLTLTKKYTELIGGTITVKSKINEGSTFTVRFPIVPVLFENGELPADKELIKNVIQNENIHKKNILIVEDDKVTIVFVQRVLKGKYIIDTAMNAIEAIEQAKIKQYDLILMDINLGRSRNGMFTTKEIRKMDNYKDTPIIAMTAFAMKGDKEDFIADGCSHYISKPFEDEELIELLEVALRVEKDRANT